MRGSYHLAEPIAAAFGGLCLGLLLAKNNTLEKINQTPKALEKLYNKFVPALYKKISQGLNFTDNKILSNYSILIFLSKLTVKVTNIIEEKIMNKSVSFVSDISKEFSKRDMILQNGNVQTYNAYAFILVTLVIALVIMGYKIIIGG